MSQGVLSVRLWALRTAVVLVNVVEKGISKEHLSKWCRLTRSGGKPAELYQYRVVYEHRKGAMTGDIRRFIRGPGAMLLLTVESRPQESNVVCAVSSPPEWGFRTWFAFSWSGYPSRSGRSTGAWIYTPKGRPAFLETYDCRRPELSSLLMPPPPMPLFVLPANWPAASASRKAESKSVINSRPIPPHIRKKFSSLCGEHDATFAVVCLGTSSSLVWRHVERTSPLMRNFSHWPTLDIP